MISEYWLCLLKHNGPVETGCIHPNSFYHNLHPFLLILSWGDRERSENFPSFNKTATLIKIVIYTVFYPAAKNLSYCTHNDQPFIIYVFILYWIYSVSCPQRLLGSMKELLSRKHYFNIMTCPHLPQKEGRIPYIWAEVHHLSYTSQAPKDEQHHWGQEAAEEQGDWTGGSDVPRGHHMKEKHHQPCPVQCMEECVCTGWATAGRHGVGRRAQTADTMRGKGGSCSKDNQQSEDVRVRGK